MEVSQIVKRRLVRESVEAHCAAFMERKIDRYLEIEHQAVIGNHYFAPASSECIYLYRDGYFIGAVMMSHAINEGIIKFVAERNQVERQKAPDQTKRIEELIEELREKTIISPNCADASIQIWRSYRNDVHHMNPVVAELDFQDLARRNLKYLAVIEGEIFGITVAKGGKMLPHQPKYWDLNDDGSVPVFLRID